MTGAARSSGELALDPRRRWVTLARCAGREDLLAGHPAELIDDLAAAGPRDVLEVGCGTGTASVHLARRGCAVLGVEPDEEMAAVARRAGVEVEIARFEEWHARGRLFDLVVSGHAWRWVDPAVGPARAAAVLGARGRIALLETAVQPLGRRAQEALRRCYESDVPFLAGRAPGLRSPPAADVAALHVRSLVLSGHFTTSHTVRYGWERRYTSAEWVGIAAAESAHAALDPARRSALLRRLGAAVDDLGGEIVVPHETICVTAARS
jgi:SAM-dependent methyltransferase